MARPIEPLAVSSDQFETLRQIISAPTSPQRIVRRAQIILFRAEGLSQQETADKIRVNRPVVSKWERRFRADGIKGLEELARSGRHTSVSDEVKGAILTDATRPPPHRTRWSVRSMAKEKQVSMATVQRVWSANGIKPHLTRTFKASNDPRFEEKFWDVIGLYLNPPEQAMVLCCDEKSQCQALERTQPGLPLGVEHIKTKTHDYRRHGTVTLFASLDYLSGKIIHQTADRHTHKEWLEFLKLLHQDTPKGLTLHIILDNYATHKHEKVRSWIAWHNKRHQNEHGCPRIELHFTPTSSSWMNLIERFFRDITEDVIRDGSFTSVKDLVADIEGYLADRNLEPKRYVWKAKGAAILEKINRARQALGLASFV
jgi:transposase